MPRLQMQRLKKLQEKTGLTASEHLRGSTDILAADKASVDMVYALPDPERRDMVERIETRSGLHQLEYMKTLHMGDDQYELITI